MQEALEQIITAFLSKLLVESKKIAETKSNESTKAKSKPEMLGETFKDSKWVSLFTKSYKEKPKAEQNSTPSDSTKDKKEEKKENTQTSSQPKDPYLSSLEKYKGISGDIGGVLSSISTSAKAVTKNFEQMFGKMDEGTATVVNDSINLIGGLGDVFSGMATMDVGKMISASMQIFQSIWSLFDEDTRQANAIIAASQKVIAEAKVEYEKLAKANKEMYSSTSSNQYDKMNEQLAKQNEEIEKQQEAEESKKAKDKDKIKEWEKEQARIAEEIAANETKAVDAIFGSDLQSAINDFANAYVDAFSKGGDAASAQKDVVKKMITGIITEMIKSDIAGKVKEIREKIAALLEDGDLSESDLEEITALANSTGEAIKSKSDNYTKILDSVGATDDKNDVSLAGQIRGTVATEASVAELGGLFRSQADSLFQINNKMTLGIQDISSIAKSSLLIEINTRQTAANTQTTNDVLGNIKTELSIISRNISKDNGIYGR